MKRQEADCRALAERRGWHVAAVYADNDLSAWSGRIRPAYGQMLDAIKGGEVDAVVVWHLDRLHRHPKELEAFFEVCDAAGIKDLASVTGDVDLSTHDGRFMARILGAVARKESDDKSRRTKRKHLELAEAGAAVGGGRPFGYETDRKTIRPDEAAMIQEAVDRVLAGDSIRGVCADWNTRGVPTVRGGRWTQTSLRRCLLGYRIAGKRSHGRNGPVVAEGTWPAIIDPDTHERVRSVLLNPSRQATAGFGARKYLLTGFVTCGRCGTRLIAQPRTDRRRSYTCSSGPGRGGCGGIRILAEPLEDLIVEAVFQRLDTPHLSAAVNEQEREGEGAEADATAVMSAAEEKLTGLATDYADDIITRAEWMTARKVVEARLEAARAVLARLRRSEALEDFVGHEGALRTAWPSLSLDRHRAVLAAVMDRVTIGPAIRGVNKFDPARVDVIWRL